MPDWVHRTDKTYLTSVSPASLPEVEANYIQDPDMSAVVGQPSKYWGITGDVVSLMDQVARDAVDAQILSDSRDGAVDEYDEPEALNRAQMLAILDDRNIWASWLRDFKTEVAAASSLGDLKTRVAGLPNTPNGSIAQMKTKVRNKLGS